MEDSVARFWDKYIAKVVDNNVPEGARRWYVRHIEMFIKYRSGQKLSGASRQYIENYIEGIGRKKYFFTIHRPRVSIMFLLKR